MKKKFIIITTVPVSLAFFKGQIQILKEKFEVELISSPGVNLDQMCDREKVKGHAIKMKREISVLNDIISLIQLIFTFSKLKPYIIHGSTPKAGLLSMIAGWCVQVPVRIYYLHGLRYQGTSGFKRWFLRSMEKISCFFATDIFSVSEGVRKILLKDRITRKKINLIGNGSVNGIDTNYFSPANRDIPDLKKEYKLLPSHFVFGFVGRLVSDKGINELVEAFMLVYENYSNARLLLVGNFEHELDPIKEGIKNEIFTNPKIIFVGYQTDIRPYLKMMDVFVFPSYREGFGISLMEAAAMEVPAISSDIIGCNEIIEDGFNGKLILPRSKEDLLKAMENFMEDSLLVKQMSSVSRNSIIEKYEQNRLWKETLAEYVRISS
ncbi:MAG: glycosyltransferase family 4 protein [Ginsengibacter sp.]